MKSGITLEIDKEKKINRIGLMIKQNFGSWTITRLLINKEKFFVGLWGLVKDCNIKLGGWVICCHRWVDSEKEQILVPPPPPFMVGFWGFIRVYFSQFPVYYFLNNFLFSHMILKKQSSLKITLASRVNPLCRQLFIIVFASWSVIKISFLLFNLYNVDWYDMSHAPRSMHRLHYS